jgi:hypothetical protein
VKRNPVAQLLAGAPFFGRQAADAVSMTCGIQGFLEPNPLAALGPNWPLVSSDIRN